MVEYSSLKDDWDWDDDNEDADASSTKDDIVSTWARYLIDQRRIREVIWSSLGGREGGPPSVSLDLSDPTTLQQSPLHRDASNCTTGDSFAFVTIENIRTRTIYFTGYITLCPDGCKLHFNSFPESSSQFKSSPHLQNIASFLIFDINWSPKWFSGTKFSSISRPKVHAPEELFRVKSFLESSGRAIAGGTFGLRAAQFGNWRIGFRFESGIDPINHDIAAS